MDRGDLMARHIAGGSKGKEDLHALISMAGCYLSMISESERNTALFELNSDTIRSGLMLIYSLNLKKSGGS